MSPVAQSLADQLRNSMKVEVVKAPTIRDIFDEEPVDLTTFVQDKKFLNSPPLSELQFDAVRHMEQIYNPETYPELVEEFGPQWAPVRFINLAWMQIGKGGGKDHICRVASARIAYLLICLKSPQAYFEMPPQDEIQTLNVASSGPQAHRAFFRPLSTICSTSPWFKDKLRSEPSDMSTSIRLNKQIEMVSGHSYADGMEGLNLIFGIADEISAFRTKEELERVGSAQKREPTKSAEAIIRLLRTSAATRFPRNYKVAAISYPRFKGDAIQQLCTRGREDNEKNGEKSRVYVSGPHATWDFNPRVKGKEVFKEDYESDPDMAEAMYECRPRLSPNRYFKNDQAIYAALDENVRCPLHILYYWGLDEELTSPTNKPKPGWQVKFQFDEDFHPISGAVYALHGDMAINGDRAGVAMSHVRTWQQSEIDYEDDNAPRQEMRPIVRNDFTAAFESDVIATLPDGTIIAREVQIRWYRKLIQELVKRKFAVEFASFDNFQSADTIQILEAWGIESKRVSMDSNTVGWSTLRDVMYDGRLESHYNPILRDELLGLTKLPNGKVDHVQGGSKDMGDALAGSVLGAVLLGGDEGDDPRPADAPGSFVDFSVYAPIMGGEGDNAMDWLTNDGVGVPRNVDYRL